MSIVEDTVYRCRVCGASFRDKATADAHAGECRCESCGSRENQRRLGAALCHLCESKRQHEREQSFVGKTVKAIVFNDGIAIDFTDGSRLTCDRDYEGGVDVDITLPGDKP